MYIQWKKEYETGNPLIDAEHRLLVMLFRKLDVAIKSCVPNATVNRIVLEVSQFVKFHFISEENLMHETKYPGLEGHMALHSKLITELNGMTRKLTLHQELPEDLLYFISDWLFRHIAHHDQILAKYVNDAKNRPVAESIYHEYLNCVIPSSISDGEL